MAFTEQVTLAAIPAFETEVSFGTIVPEHDKVAAWADMSAIALQVKTKIAWRIYVTQSGIVTMAKEFGPFDVATPPCLVGVIDAIPGATYELRGIVTYGAVSATAIKGGLTGYNDQVDTAISASQVSHTLTQADQLFGTVAVFHTGYQVRLDFGASTNPASRWRLYATVTGGGGTIIALVDTYTITKPPVGGTFAIDLEGVGAQLWTLYGVSIDPLAVGPLAPTVNTVLLGFDRTLEGVGGGVVLGGNVIGPSGANSVVAMTGAAGSIPIAATGAVMDWAAATVTPGLKQDAAVADVLPQNIIVTPQAPFPGAPTVANRGAGSFFVNLPANVAGAASNNGIGVEYAGTPIALMGQISGLGNAYGALWLGPSAAIPTVTNPVIYTDGNDTFLLGNTSIRASLATNQAINISSTQASIRTAAGAFYAFDFSSTAILHFTINTVSAAIKYDDDVTAGATGKNMSIHGQAVPNGATGVGGQVSIGGGAALGNYGDLLVDSPLDIGSPGAGFTFAANAPEQLSAAASAKNMLIINDGVLLAPGTLTISRPIATAGMIFVRNNNTQAVTIQFLAGAGVSMLPNTSALITTTGAAAVKLMSGT